MSLDSSLGPKFVPPAPPPPAAPTIEKHLSVVLAVGDQKVEKDVIANLLVADASAPVVVGQTKLGDVTASVIAERYDKEIPAPPPPPPEPDTRPLHFCETPHKGPAPRVDPYELGAPNTDGGDFWSDSGQVSIDPTDSTHPGLCAYRSYAYARGCYATAPRWDAYRKSDPSPSMVNSTYVPLFGANSKAIKHVRSQSGGICNDCLVLMDDGLIVVDSTQTGHGGLWPSLRLPANKVPLDITLTSGNELALVAVWDSVTHLCELQVIMMEGKYLPIHTFSEMGFPNQGSFSAFALLGSIKLFACDSAPLVRLDAASNYSWSGPSATNSKTLGQVDTMLKDSAQTTLSLLNGAWSSATTKGAYVVVIASDRKEAHVVDLTPTIQYIRDSYLVSAEAFNATLAARALGTWPKAFADVELKYTPYVRKVLTFDDRPVSVLCGRRVGRWSKDRFKFFIGLEKGQLVIFDSSVIMARETWNQKGTDIVELGRIDVPENPIGLCFTRRNDGLNNPLYPAGNEGDGYNSCVYVACRKARKVVGVLTLQGKGVINRVIEDQRLSDPVAVTTAVRGNIVLVCDYDGKQIVGFRVGSITDKRQTPNVTYPITNGSFDFEMTGVHPLPGKPFSITSENVN